MLTSNNILFKKIIKTMITIIFAQLLLICVGFVDNVMINQYDSKQIHFEAVGIGSEIWYFFQTFFLSLGIVFGVLYSQFKNNQKNFSETFKVSIYVTFIIVIISSLLIFFTAEYFVDIFYNKPASNNYQVARSIAIKYIKILSIGNIFVSISYMLLLPMLMIGKTKYSLINSLISLLANFLFDYIFIYIIDMGAEGAAWATVMSYSLQLITTSIFVYWNREFYKIKTPFFKIDYKILKMVLKRWTIFVSSVIMYSSYSFTTMILVSMYGSDLIKSLTLAYMISGIMWTLIPAVKQTTNIFLGEKLGSNSFDKANKMLKMLFKIFFITNIIVSAIGFSLAWWVPNVMLNDSSIVKKARIAIIIFSLANFIYIFQTFYSSILETGGRQLYPNIFNYFAPFWTAIPTIIISGPWVIGLDFEIVFALDNISIGLTLIVLWLEVRKKKWLINLNVAKEKQ